MKRYFSLVFLLFISFHLNRLYAQQSSTPTRQKEIGLGALYYFVASENKTYSSLPFTGSAPGAILSLASRRNEVSDELTISYYKVKMTPDAGKEIYSISHPFSADYVRAYKINVLINSGFEFQAGPAINFLYARNHNSGLVNSQNTLDEVISLAGAAGLKYKFPFSGPQITVEDMINIPFVSGVHSPSYSAESLQGNKMEIASFGSFTRVVNNIAVCLQWREEEKLRFSYHFDYRSFSSGSRIRQLAHGLELTYIFLL